MERMKNYETQTMKLRKGIAFILLLCIAFVNCYDIAYAGPGSVLLPDSNNISVDENVITDETGEVEENEESENTEGSEDIEEPEELEGSEEPEETEESDNGDILSTETNDTTQIMRTNLVLNLGDGTEANPFIIADVEAFINIRDNLSAFYKLASDIDFNDETLIPIGTSTMPFKGSLDGDGHTLKNFKRSTASGNTGLFS